MTILDQQEVVHITMILFKKFLVNLNLILLSFGILILENQVKKNLQESMNIEMEMEVHSQLILLSIAFKKNLMVNLLFLKDMLGNLMNTYQNIIS